MPSNRPNLTLDQQFFQELLSAAYTIQQHNDQLDRNEEQPEGDSDLTPTVQKASEAASQAQPNNACPQCGANLSEGAPCEHCIREQFRPGERMQRNWASMWLMSQQQGLWPERPADESDQDAIPEGPMTEVKRKPRTATARDLAASGILSLPVGSEPREEVGSENGGAAGGQQVLDHQNGDRQNGNRQNGNHKNGNRQNGDRKNGGSIPSGRKGKSILNKSAVEEKPVSNWNLGETEETASDDFRLEESPRQHVVSDDSASPFQAFEPSANDASTLAEAGEIYDASSTDALPEENAVETMLHRAADWRVRLRFHRADLYLGVAIFVAATALIWPTAGAQQPSLSLWQRTLVTLGVAEVQAPATHFLGDPAIEVWIDPHSALYYCPGEEQYGKTTDGRFTSQREAQTDRFEPAGRSACE